MTFIVIDKPSWKNAQSTAVSLPRTLGKISKLLGDWEINTMDHFNRNELWILRALTFLLYHYSDAMAPQITGLTIVYSIVFSGADHRNHQTSASRAFVWGMHRWPVNSPHIGPVTRNMFPFDDVIMIKIFQDMGAMLCVKFQRAPLKFYAKHLNHVLKDMTSWKVEILRAHRIPSS